MTYDVIIVGARVAGSATAMLLARAGLQVLVIDTSRWWPRVTGCARCRCVYPGIGVSASSAAALEHRVGDERGERGVRFDAGVGDVRAGTQRRPGRCASGGRGSACRPGRYRCDGASARRRSALVIDRSAARCARARPAPPRAPRS